ncbi:MAG: DUF885 domain-containing protein [Actinobacteria bacterium]|nr:DUF885 domain-containing protein [Actinomycetota bacterium]MBI3685868.1 DUF885 domain-containing protein [Actinomycetota bacterium]
MDVPREYLRLGLRFDRLEEGFVDAFTGDPELRASVGDEPPPDPARLAETARGLIAELPVAGLPADRTDFLAGQLAALECGARRFAGEPVGFVEEVTAYFQVVPELGDQDRYALVHSELDRLLPGQGALAERYAAFRRRDECPPEKLAAAVHELSGALRERVRSGYGLPAAEIVEYQVVTDKPWSGFNYYLGGYRSRVAINADLPHRLGQLPQLVAHESYPGHHTEHCRKDQGLVERDGQVEQQIFLVNTPQCLLAEGLADLGLAAAVGSGWGPWAAEIYADLGLPFDGELAERVNAAVLGLDQVRQDAALMLHDRGWDADRVAAYLTRWLLVGEDRARQSLRFLSHPLWRAYTSTYVEGYRLLSRWLAAQPDGQGVATAFLRLLDEPLTPARVGAELAEAGVGRRWPVEPVRTVGG